MNLRKALLMSLVLALGLLLMWSYEEKHPGGGDASQDVAKPFLLEKVPLEQIEEISVVHGNDSYSVMRAKTDDSAKSEEKAPLAKWIMKHPLNAPANSSAIEQILTALKGLEVENTLDADEVHQDQRLYGLVPPHLVLTLKASDRKHVFSFGKQHAISGRRYLQREDDAKRYLVDETIFTALKVPRKEVRDRFPLKFKVSELRSLGVVRNGMPPLLFEKKEGASKGTFYWQVTGAMQTVEADSSFIEKELLRLSRTEVAHFVDEPLVTMAVYGLSNPALLFKISLSAGDRTRDILVQVGKGVSAKAANGQANSMIPRSSYFLRIVGSPWIYELERFFIGSWSQPLQYYRDKTPFNSAKVSDVEKVVIASSHELGQLWTWVKKGREGSSSWEFVKETNDETSSEKLAAREVEKYLRSILALEVLSYPALQTKSQENYAFDKPEYRVELHFGAKSAPYSIAFGARVESLTSSVDRKSRGEGSIDSEAPRYMLLGGEDAQKLPAVISAESVRKLEEAISYFRPTQR